MVAKSFGCSMLLASLSCNVHHRKAWKMILFDVGGRCNVSCLDVGYLEGVYVMHAFSLQTLAPHLKSREL